MPISKSLLDRIRANDQNLVEIDIPGLVDCLTSNDMEILVDAAKDNTNLKVLLLDENKIGDEGCKHLSSLKNIETLTLRGNDITNDGVEWIKKMSSLKYLSLPDNYIDDKGFAQLFYVDNIKSLVVSENNLTNESALLALNDDRHDYLFLSNDIIDRGLLDEIYSNRCGESSSPVSEDDKNDSSASWGDVGSASWGDDSCASIYSSRLTIWGTKRQQDEQKSANVGSEDREVNLAVSEIMKIVNNTCENLNLDSDKQKLISILFKLFSVDQKLNKQILLSNIGSESEEVKLALEKIMDSVDKTLMSLSSDKAKQEITLGLTKELSSLENKYGSYFNP